MGTTYYFRPTQKGTYYSLGDNLTITDENGYWIGDTNGWDSVGVELLANTKYYVEGSSGGGKWMLCEYEDLPDLSSTGEASYSGAGYMIYRYTTANDGVYYLNAQIQGTGSFWGDCELYDKEGTRILNDTGLIELQKNKEHLISIRNYQNTCTVRMDKLESGGNVTEGIGFTSESPSYYTFVPKETGEYTLGGIAHSIYDTSWNQVSSTSQGYGMTALFSLEQGQTYYIVALEQGSGRIDSATKVPLELNKDYSVPEQGTVWYRWTPQDTGFYYASCPSDAEGSLELRMRKKDSDSSEWWYIENTTRLYEKDAEYEFCCTSDAQTELAWKMERVTNAGSVELNKLYGPQQKGCYTFVPGETAKYESWSYVELYDQQYQTIDFTETLTAGKTYYVIPNSYSSWMIHKEGEEPCLELDKPVEIPAATDVTLKVKVPESGMYYIGDLESDSFAVYFVDGDVWKRRDLAYYEAGKEYQVHILHWDENGGNKTVVLRKAKVIGNAKTGKEYTLSQLTDQVGYYTLNIDTTGQYEQSGGAIEIYRVSGSNDVDTMVWKDVFRYDLEAGKYYVVPKSRQPWKLDLLETVPELTVAQKTEANINGRKRFRFTTEAGTYYTLNIQGIAEENIRIYYEDGEYIESVDYDAFRLYNETEGRSYYIELNSSAPADVQLLLNKVEQKGDLTLGSTYASQTPELYTYTPKKNGVYKVESQNQVPVSYTIFDEQNNLVASDSPLEAKKTYQILVSPDGAAQWKWYSEDVTEPDYMNGDGNEDGMVNLIDLRLTLRAICKKITLTERQQEILDVNHDGAVNLLDLRMMLRYICKKIDTL